MVDLALATLPSPDRPSASLLSGPVHEISLIPGVNHAFGLESNDGTQRISLDIYLASVAELAGRDSIDPNQRGRSSSADTPAAERAAASTLAAFDPRLRLDASVEAVMRNALADHRAEVRRYWVSQHTALRQIAMTLSLDPVGGSRPPRDESQAYGQAREQMRVLSRLARDAGKQIDRQVAQLAKANPEHAEDERRRLSLLAANTRARLDAIERDEPSPDPLRARVWDLLNDAQRTYVVSAIRRRYLAQRLERDGLDADEIRRQLAPTMASAGLMAGQMTGQMNGQMNGQITNDDAAGGEMNTMPQMTGETPSVTASGASVSSDPLMTMMSSMNDSGLRIELEPVTPNGVLAGTFDDVLISAAQRRRLSQLHPGELQRELIKLRQRALEEAFPLEYARRYRTPPPPTTRDALAGD